MSRNFVVGLDGAGWRLLEPWLEAGQLPTLAHIRAQGVHATNRSCLPPVTFPNWKCYSSGKNPGKFGVFWWEHINLKRETIKVTGGPDFDTAEMWDYLNQAGYRTGVVNMPATYPPRPLDGPVVSGGPDAVEGEYRSLSSGYTHPPELEERLRSEYDYSVHPDPLLSSNRDGAAEIDEILRLLKVRLEVAEDLFREQDLDFMHVTLFYLNVLHHFFWDGEPTRRAWRLVDEKVADLLELEDTNVILVSDHGSAPTETEFYVNEWLAKNGYLTRRLTLDEAFRSIGLTRDNALTFAKRLGIVDVLATTVPERLQRFVPQRAGVKRGRKMEAIVPDETLALASGQGPVYLHPSSNYDDLRSTLQSKFLNLTNAEGTPLFTDVHMAEDVYHGQYVDGGPDIVLEQQPGVHVNDGIGGEVVLGKPDRWVAENTRRGIFAAIGPAFRNDGDIGEIEILDIAPTLLAQFGVPVPEDVDGRVLDILRDDSRPGTQDPIEPTDTMLAPDNGSVERRLTRLGYMEE